MIDTAAFCACPDVQPSNACQHASKLGYPVQDGDRNDLGKALE